MNLQRKKRRKVRQTSVFIASQTTTLSFFSTTSPGFTRTSTTRLGIGARQLACCASSGRSNPRDWINHRGSGTPTAEGLLSLGWSRPNTCKRSDSTTDPPDNGCGTTVDTTLPSENSVASSVADDDDDASSPPPTSEPIVRTCEKLCVWPAKSWTDTSSVRFLLPPVPDDPGCRVSIVTRAVRGASAAPSPSTPPVSRRSTVRTCLSPPKRKPANVVHGVGRTPSDAMPASRSFKYNAACAIVCALGSILGLNNSSWCF
jgi:hypothetical protein